MYQIWQPVYLSYSPLYQQGGIVSSGHLYGVTVSTSVYVNTLWMNGIESSIQMLTIITID